MNVLKKQYCDVSRWCLRFPPRFTFYRGLLRSDQSKYKMCYKHAVKLYDNPFYFFSAESNMFIQSHQQNQQNILIYSVKTLNTGSSINVWLLNRCLKMKKHSALNNNLLLVMSFGCLVEKSYTFSVIEESMNMLDTRCFLPKNLF